MVEEKKIENKTERKSVPEKKLTMADFNKRVSRTHGKAGFVGIMYFIFSLVFAAIGFLPMFIYEDKLLSVMNCWSCFDLFKNFQVALVPTILRVLPYVLYILILYSEVINVIRALCKVPSLFARNPSKQNGYNRPVKALVSLGKIYTCSYGVILLFGYLMHIVGDVTCTPTFYVVALLGLLIHFWLGVSGGKVSHFRTAERFCYEETRNGGRVLPFFRNFLQVLIVVFLMYFFEKYRVGKSIFGLLNPETLQGLFGENMNMTNLYYQIFLPVLQALMLLFIVVLFNHATGTKEFRREGKKTKGRKCFLTFSILLLLVSVATWVVPKFVLGGEEAGIYSTMMPLYIAALALAGFILEIFTVSLPTENPHRVYTYIRDDFNSSSSRTTRREYSYRSSTDSPFGENLVSADGTFYKVPLQCISEPGVFMQPNGVPILVMPMVKTEEVKNEVAPSYEPEEEPAETEQPAIEEQPVKPALAPAPTSNPEPHKELPKEEPEEEEEDSELSKKWKKRASEVDEGNDKPYSQQNPMMQSARQSVYKK